jgi:protein-disulfide isomerase
MGFWRRPLALIAVVVLATTGCTGQTSGITHADADQPGAAPSSDGYGVMLGSPNAPVQLETFIEPQCPHCAQFEATHGDAIAGYLADGRLAMTYRPMTFLDKKNHNDASARIGDALFLAIDVATSATAYQAFVQDLYRHQNDASPVSNEDIAAMARESGVPEWVATRIAAGDPAVNSNAMAAANMGRLKAENPANPVTPTVYDLKANSVVDIQDPDWLDNMFS